MRLHEALADKLVSQMEKHMSVTAMKKVISEALNDSHLSNGELQALARAQGQAKSKNEQALYKGISTQVASGTITVENKDRFDALIEGKPSTPIGRFAAGSGGVVTLSFLLSQTWIGKPLAIPALIAASPLIAAAAIAMGVKVMITD